MLTGYWLLVTRLLCLHGFMLARFYVYTATTGYWLLVLLLVITTTLLLTVQVIMQAKLTVSLVPAISRLPICIITDISNIVKRERSNMPSYLYHHRHISNIVVKGKIQYACLCQEHAR